MQNFINISLEIFYALMGFLMIVIAYKSFTTINNNKKYGTSLFWILISLPFIFGRLIPANIIGIILILSSLLTLSKQVVFAKYEEPDENFGKEQADRLLCYIGRILNDNIKDGELVCRDSADVFYMFLLETEKNILEVRLKEILEKIRTSSNDSNNNCINISPYNN